MPVIPVSVWCQLPHPPLAWTPPSVALAQSCLHSLQSPISDRQTAVWCSLSTAEAVLPAGKATEGQRGSCIERLPGPFLPVALRGQVGPPHSHAPPRSLQSWRWPSLGLYSYAVGDILLPHSFLSSPVCSPGKHILPSVCECV